jgi:hypothetical protein
VWRFNGKHALTYTGCSAVKPTDFASVFRRLFWAQKNSYKTWVDSASLSQCGPKWLFALVMMLSTKTPIMIAMSNPPLHFLFVVYRLKLEKIRAYSIHSTWLIFNVSVIKVYITPTSLSHVRFKMSTSCLYTCYKTYLQWLRPLRADQFISDASSSCSRVSGFPFKFILDFIQPHTKKSNGSTVSQVTEGAIDQQNVHWTKLLPLS